LIRKQCPNIVLNIVGSNFTTEFIESLGCPGGIRYLGWLSDDQLVAAYRKAAIVVVPLRFGAGLKGKVLEALYYGVPIVSTTIGLEGFPEMDLLYKGYDSASVFSERALHLYGSVASRRHLVRRQIAYVHKYFSVHEAVKSVLQIFS